MDEMFGDVEELVRLCETTITPTVEENYEYLIEAIGRSEMLRQRFEVLGPANHERLRVSIGLWDLFFPDHCRGDTVFFAGIARSAFDTYVPALFIACRHFEHGDEYPELEHLAILLKVAAMEAFRKASRYWYEIIVLDPVAEKLAVALMPMAPESSEEESMARAYKTLVRLRLIRPDNMIALDAIPRLLEGWSNNASQA